MTADEVRQIIREELQRNYSSGAPAVPPHTHNGIDNLQLPATSIIGDAVTGDVVTQIVAGSNITVSPSTGVGVVTVSSSGGGGGTPGGSDTQVQFNDSSAFGGDSAFTWNKTSNTLTLDDGNGAGGGGDIISSGLGDLSIQSEDEATSGYGTGNINIATGDYTGADGLSSGRMIISVGNTDPDSIPSSLDIVGGDCGDVSSEGNNGGGDITITAGSTGNSSAGDVLITSGSATTSGDGGLIRLRLGGTDSGNRKYVQFSQFDAFGTVQPNVAISTSTPSFGGAQGSLYMRNRTTAPSSSPSSGGVIYVESGALHYIGSSGTDTTIAPA